MVFPARTREQLRTSIGYLLNAIYVSSASSNGNAGGTTLVDNTLTADAAGFDDDLNGKWVVVTSGGNDGNIRRIDDYDGASTTATLRTAATGQITSGMTYELWDEEFPPTSIHEFINLAVDEATDAIYDPVEDLSLHGDRIDVRHDIPSGISIINSVWFRDYVKYTDIHLCDRKFDETTDSDFTQVLDDEDRKEGAYSLRLTVASGASAGDRVTDSINSLDISKYDYLEFWFKTTVTTTAGQIQVLLDDTAGAGSPLETISIPATTADTWTYHRVALANPELDIAIISVGVKYTSDIGAAVLWFDHIKATEERSATWQKLSAQQWRIDRANRDLVLTPTGRDYIGYKLIRLVGGDKPDRLASDSTSTQVPDRFIVNYATAMALSAVGDHTRAGHFMQLAERARRDFTSMSSGRKIS